MPQSTTLHGITTGDPFRWRPLSCTGSPPAWRLRQLLGRPQTVFPDHTDTARRWKNKAEAVYIANGPSITISAEPLPPLTDDIPSTYSLFSSFSVFYPSPVPPVHFIRPPSFHSLLILPRTRCSSCFRFSLLLGIPFYVMHIIYTLFSIYYLL